MVREKQWWEIGRHFKYKSAEGEEVGWKGVEEEDGKRIYTLPKSERLV